MVAPSVKVSLYVIDRCHRQQILMPAKWKSSDQICYSSRADHWRKALQWLFRIDRYVIMLKQLSDFYVSLVEFLVSKKYLIFLNVWIQTESSTDMFYWKIDRNFQGRKNSRLNLWCALVGFNPASNRMYVRLLQFQKIDDLFVPYFFSATHSRLRNRWKINLRLGVRKAMMSHVEIE